MATLQPLQYGLRELFIWITSVAVAFSIFMTWRQAIVIWLVFYALNCRMLRAYVRRIPDSASRRAAFCKRFWRVAWLILPVSLCLDFVILADTYRNYGMDGYEGVGWPAPFMERGGFSYHEHHSVPALTLDVAASLAIAVATGLALRDGGRRLSTVVARFFRGRSLTPPVR